MSGLHLQVLLSGKSNKSSWFVSVRSARILTFHFEKCPCELQVLNLASHNPFRFQDQNVLVRNPLPLSEQRKRHDAGFSCSAHSEFINGIVALLCHPGRFIKEPVFVRRRVILTPGEGPRSYPFFYFLTIHHTYYTVLTFLCRNRHARVDWTP